MMFDLVTQQLSDGPSKSQNPQSCYERGLTSVDLKLLPGREVVEVHPHVVTAGCKAPALSAVAGRLN